MEWFNVNFEIDIGSHRYIRTSIRMGNPSSEGPISKDELSELFICYLREEIRPFVTVISIIPDEIKGEIIYE